MKARRIGWRRRVQHEALAVSEAPPGVHVVKGVAVDRQPARTRDREDPRAANRYCRYCQGYACRPAPHPHARESYLLVRASASESMLMGLRATLSARSHSG